MKTVKLNNGIEMPILGYGVYQIGIDECEQCVSDAIAMGYRLIDTAQAYHNEEGVGAAIKKSGIKREDFFIVTKLWISNYGEEKARKSIYESLKKLQTDYVDLLFLHQPFGDYYGAYRAMEEAYKNGVAKAIGVSNFDKDEELFDSFMKTVAIKPQIMQLECHPYAQRDYWQKKLKENNIQQENWYPLGGRQSKGIILNDPIINKIAKAHKKSAAQIVIRWHIQKGFSIIPGSSNPDNIRDNIDAFDFSLNNDEMEMIEKLNTEKRIFDPPYEQQKQMYLNTILID